VGYAFHARTGIHPIMHVAVMRKAILNENPWVARNLYNAFDEARRHSLARLRRPGYIALPGHAEMAQVTTERFGGDYFPYGIEENRAALELFLRYAHEQGIARRPMTPEEIFPPGIMVKAAV
jgi:4,5-dihydroxyphthalate decarboxylase